MKIFRNKKINILVLFFLFCSLNIYGKSSFTCVGYIGDKGTSLGKLESPCGISIDINGFVYVADSGNHRIQKFSRRGDFIDYRGGLGWSGENFDKPYDIFAKSVLDMFIIDYNANRIIRYDKDMNYLSSLSKDDIKDDNFMFGYPSGICVSKRGDIFIIDGENKRVLKINSLGEPEMSFGGFENLGFQLEEPFQIALSKNNNVFVSDVSLAKVFVFDYFGNFKFEIGGMESSAGIDIDSKGRLFVADLKGCAVYIFNEDGILLDKIEGHNIGGGEILEEPIDIVYNDGLLYIADRKQCRIYILKENP